ncbi:MAG TPA: response regulator transcription factor, partial [Polyangiaceae bacterium]|nr:response regulator transcription factor [Polyangiaceae bacterium]
MKRRIVLVDDHELVRAGVRSALGDRVDVVGEAGDVESAIAVIQATRPDVVLLDVHLPGGNGPAVIRGLSDSPARFLALSVSDAALDVIEVIRAGARGYVTKAISAEELLDAIERVAAGDAVFSPRLAGFVLDAFAQQPVAAPDPELDELTLREQEVLRLLARGYAYKEIASRLSISVKTVESHASAVLRKLQLSNRRELSRWA